MQPAWQRALAREASQEEFGVVRESIRHVDKATGVVGAQAAAPVVQAVRSQNPRCWDVLERDDRNSLPVGERIKWDCVRRRIRRICSWRTKSRGILRYLLSQSISLEISRLQFRFTRGENPLWNPHRIRQTVQIGNPINTKERTPDPCWSHGHHKFIRGSADCTLFR